MTQQKRKAIFALLMPVVCMAPAPPVRRLYRGTEEEDATQLKLGILQTSYIYLTLVI